MKTTLEQLKLGILSKYKSIHAFCKQNEHNVKRSSVYLILAGKYLGNVTKQVQKITEILNNKKEQTPAITLTNEETYSVLQESKCAHCRKPDKRACMDCKTQTAREAQAIESYLRRKHE